MTPARLVPILGVLLACAAGPASAAGRERVDIAARPWNAVGQVNTASYGRCTGVLIGARLAVTAAHCVYNRAARRFLPPGAIHFVLGYDRGRFGFATVAAAVRIGLGYDPERPLDSLRSDWALLTLAEPAPSSVEPIVVAERPPEPGNTFASAGFGRDRAYALTVAASCRYLSGYASGLLAAECSIIQGYSGGPMLNGEGRLVGIQVAGGKGRNGEVAFAVPASAWADQVER